MRNLSKSKILAFRQCPKRLWLEIHKPELRDDSASEMVFAIGNQVGEVARQVFDPHGNGAFIDINVLGHAEAISQSAMLLANGSGPLFEAGITASGALAYADVMLPDRSDGTLRWRMIEVKSSTSVKDYHRDDIAVQSFIAVEAGVPLASISVAHINNAFTYYGGGRYDGLFEVVDLTKETVERHEEVRQWLTLAHEIANQPEEPAIETGDHCNKPFTCGFCDYCNRDKIWPEYPLSSLPGIRQARRAAIEETGVDDLREAPDELLSAIQQRVKDCSVSGEPYFNAEGAAAELAAYGDPWYFLDFETIMFAVPTWEGTRPYQQLPFQFSLHIVHEGGRIEHQGFLDLSGADPSQACAVELIRLCGNKGPIFAYNAGFESRVIRELGERFPELASRLSAIAARLVDLLPIARRHYYHPSQHGSWSIKAVLPALCPDLSYDDLNGVQDGNMAQTAYQEAIAPDTTGKRKAQLKEQLHEYCKLDTLAMVRIWQKFHSGANPKTVSVVSQPQASMGTAPPSSDVTSQPRSPTFQIRKVVDRVIKDYWDAVQRNLKSSRPLTGISRLDDVTCGLGPGVHILAGRPSTGKTSLMLSMIQNMCVEDKLPCLIFSGDHSALHLTHRMIFSRASLPTRITYAAASYHAESEKDALRNSASEIAAAPLFIEDSFDLTVESIQSIAARYKDDENIGFIAVENLEMLRTNFTRIELSREREVVEIVAKLRGLARELDIPILLIAGLNNGPETRNDSFGCPRMSDLPYYNLIEGLVMTVSLLYRPSYYAENHEDQERLKGSIKMILCKNNYGITTVIDLAFDETCGRFEDDSHTWIE